MIERGTPVVILFIIAIVVMLFNYHGTMTSENIKLNQIIDDQEVIIDKLSADNQKLSIAFQYWYQMTMGNGPGPHDADNEVIH